MTLISRKFRVASAVFGGLAVLALGLTPAPAVHFRSTQTSPTTFAVSANVPLSCSVATGNVNFGNYSGTVLDIKATTTVTCSSPTPFHIEYGPGLHSTICTARRMVLALSFPQQFLPYTLFDGSPAGGVLGTLLDAPACVAPDETGGTSQTVHGQIIAGLSPPAGSYSDQIAVTLRF